MYYKKSNSIGVREKFDEKRQVFSYGGKKTSLREDGLRGWGDEVLTRLDKGQSCNKVKKWIRDIVKKIV